ncbi:MAG: bacteriohemerythrin [Rhodoferax sp.]|jgi:hemerythrin
MSSETTILWTQDLNTGIDVLDNQHKRIVDYINQLGSAIKLRDRGAVGAVLNELVDYTISHFAFEESLQEEAGYQYAKPHKAVHEVFIKRVAKFQEKHDSGEDVAAQLHAMLSTWLIHHIKRDDMAYVKEVNASINRIVENKKEGNWLSRSLGRFFK